MNLGELHQELALAMKRGDSLNDIIPAVVRQGAMFLERNHTFEYMKIFYTTQTSIDADPRVIELPFYVKRLDFLRWNIGGDLKRLRKIDPAELSTIESGLPGAYWVSGAQHIILDKTPEEQLEAELGLVKLTSWPIAPEARPWLVEMASDLMFAEGMRRLSAHVKDDQRVATWQLFRDEALRTVLASDDEFREADQSYQMVGQ